MNQLLVIEKFFNFIHRNDTSNYSLGTLLKVFYLKNYKCTLQVSNKIDFLGEHNITKYPFKILQFG